MSGRAEARTYLCTDLYKSGRKYVRDVIMSVMLLCASRNLVQYTRTCGHDIEMDVNVSGTINCLSRATDTVDIVGVTRYFNMFKIFKEII